MRVRNPHAIARTTAGFGAINPVPMSCPLPKVADLPLSMTYPEDIARSRSATMAWCECIFGRSPESEQCAGANFVAYPWTWVGRKERGWLQDDQFTQAVQQAEKASWGEVGGFLGQDIKGPPPDPVAPPVAPPVTDAKTGSGAWLLLALAAAKSFKLF